MPPYHLEAGQAFGAGGQYVILVQHLQHGGAHQAGDQSNGIKRKGEHRQHPVPPAQPLAGREYLQLHGKSQLQNVTDDEIGDGNADDGDEHADIIDGLARLLCGDGAQEQAYHQSKAESADAQSRGIGKGLGNGVVYGTAVVDQGIAQVSLEQVAQVGEILLDKRFIHAIVGHHVGFDGRCHLIAVEGIAGQQAHQDEDESDQHQQCDHGDEAAFDDISCHRLNLFRSGESGAAAIAAKKRAVP